MRKKLFYRSLLPFITAVIILLSSQTLLLRSFNRWAADTLYVRQRQHNNDIVIIRIDPTTEAAYGNFSDWTRQHAADLVNYLNTPQVKPAIIGFDITYGTNRNEEGDLAFAKAAEDAGNVVIAARAFFEEKVLLASNGKIQDINAMHVSKIEYPYKALRAVTTCGFSDAILDEDNQVRMSCLSVIDGNEELYSFSYEVYRRYCELKKLSVYVPKTNLSSHNIFGIRYIQEPGVYESYSWSDVIAGKYPQSIFKDKIVLVGAYASGMLDQYQVPIAKNSPMFGVEIHANLIDSLLRGQSYQIAPEMLVIFLNLILCILFMLLLLKSNLLTALVKGAVVIFLYFVVALVVFGRGYLVYPATFPVMIVGMLLLYIIMNYVIERLEKRKLVKEFKKYVAKQVLDRMLKDGELSIQLGGEEKDIAVLFVDIRGFTTLSEALSPGQVVEMLNEYLALTTECIFKNGGTLDKFIGDATMAVFNTPFDLPDYELKAVQTAMDIVHGAEQANKRIKEKIGCEVAFGVGVNCGKAIVGNIGCENRMDYTAIGDVVNTAARLEGKALGGQVIISQMLKERLEGRIVTKSLGKMSLKGKVSELEVYSVLSIVDTKE